MIEFQQQELEVVILSLTSSVFHIERHSFVHVLLHNQLSDRWPHIHSRIVWYTEEFMPQWLQGVQILWLQNEPKSSPFHHRASQLVWGVCVGVLRVVFTEHGESKVLTKVWLLRYEVSTRLLFKVEWTLKQLTCLQIYISTHHRKANSVIFTSLKEKKKKLYGVCRSKSEFKCWLTLNNRILAGYYVS